jgi:hypothetical protein
VWSSIILFTSFITKHNFDILEKEGRHVELTNVTPATDHSNKFWVTSQTMIIVHDEEGARHKKKEIEKEEQKQHKIEREILNETKSFQGTLSGFYQFHENNFVI